MKAKLVFFVCFFWMTFERLAEAQFDGLQIKVYDFDEGLSHRNTFKVLQDQNGFLWIATINGLNRFDGYEFLQYGRGGLSDSLPYEAITDMLIDRDEVWLSLSDYFAVINPYQNKTRHVSINPNIGERRASKVPYNPFKDSKGNLWMAVYDEITGETNICKITSDGKLHTLFQSPGLYLKRPIVEWNGNIYVGVYENELWRIDENGKILEKIHLPVVGGIRSSSRIIQLSATKNRIWIVCANGCMYYLDKNDPSIKRHRICDELPEDGLFASALIESNGDIWLCGEGSLLHFSSFNGNVIDYDSLVHQQVDYNINYRQALRDMSGVVWIASNFGLIKINPSENLFATYLTGGDENCSDGYCSMRGITEDENGQIYFSYYNSIHVLDVPRNQIRPLFPAGNFFNPPFGILYHEGAIWTGNGRKIDLQSQKVDTLFNHSTRDLGVVIHKKSGGLWFGFENKLYYYDAAIQKLEDYFKNNQFEGRIKGEITYLLENSDGSQLWIGTLDNGLYSIDIETRHLLHFDEKSSGTVALHHNRVNALYNEQDQYLWIGTGDGLHRWRIGTDSMEVFGTENGLPNNFINGILSEGDSCFWISTDFGLCRFSPPSGRVSNFFLEDGLSSNEFNRISFYKSRNGRMYFGGLNGVVAFLPETFVQRQQREKPRLPIILTQVLLMEGKSDSIITLNYRLSDGNELILSPKHRMLGLGFALADYRQPPGNQYSFKMEGMEEDWSTPTSTHLVRYNNLPAGRYVFKVRARASKEAWMQDELEIPIIVKQAFHRTWQFWTLCFIAFMLGTYGFMRYRLYASLKRQEYLEKLVSERTVDLEKEKIKSEELLLNILPAEIAEELKNNGTAKARRHNTVTVMFSDFKSFTKISERLDPEILVAEIDYCFRAFDQIIEKHGLEKIKTVGDAYLCVGGINKEGEGEAVQVVKAGMEIQEFMNGVAIEKEASSLPFFEARIGIHTGPVVAGIVGIKKFAYDIWGDTVNVASRMETSGIVGKVNVSQTTYDAVKHAFKCSFFKTYEAGDREQIDMYLVEEYLGETEVVEEKKMQDGRMIS